LAFGGCFFGVQSNHHHAKSEASQVGRARRVACLDKETTNGWATNTIPLQALSRRWARVAKLSGDLRAEKMALQ
jgi:hypothetical protein